MIVVGLIGILSSVALAGYNDYIKTSSMAVVHDHYEQGIRAVRGEYAAAYSSASLGVVPAIPATANGWINLINANAGRAPGGGLAFIPGTGSAEVGAVGVAVSGSWAGGDSQVTLTQPAYADLTVRTEVISM